MGSLLEVSNIIEKHINDNNPVKASYKVAETETREITMENGEFTLFRTLFDREVSISVIKDKKLGKTSINKFDEESIKEAVDTAISSASSGNPDDAYDIADGMEPAEFKRGALEPDIDKLMERAQEFANDIAERYPKVLVMQLMFKYVRVHSLFRNTNGTMDDSTEGYYIVSAEYAGNDGENSTGLSGGYILVDNLDKPFIEIGTMDYDLKSAQDSLELAAVEGKFVGDVIFTPGCFGQMLMFSLGIFISDDVLVDGTSLWKDKLGKKVASDKFTLKINPWDERIVGGSIRTVDGFRSEECSVIENGVLKSFGLSLYGANKCGQERAKATDLDVVIEAGDVALGDMIKSIDRGLIVGAISCGFPSANGEISGVAKNSFYVENGEIKGAVMETMVSFTLSDMMENIVELSKELPLDGTAVIPYVKATGITISGK